MSESAVRDHQHGVEKVGAKVLCEIIKKRPVNTEAVYVF